MKSSRMLQFIVSIVFLIGGCQSMSKPNHRHWTGTSAIVASVVQHHLWVNGTMPISYEEIQSAAQSIKDNDAPLTEESFTWKLLPPQSPYGDTSTFGATIRITYENSKSGFSDSIEFDFNTRPREMWWTVHKYYAPDGSQVVAMDERNCANLLATLTYERLRSAGKLPDHNVDLPDWPIEKSMTVSKLRKQYQVTLAKDSQGEWLRILSVASGNEYWYPSDGPFSERKCKLKEREKE